MYILALDGGGTKTLARVYTLSGEIMKEAVGPSSNIHSDSYDNILIGLKKLFSDNFSEYLDKIDIVSGGMAGAGREADKECYRKLFNELGFKTSVISTDAHSALIGAHGKRNGALLICGTGSIALYLDGDREERVGGYGHILGDEGSGYFFGLEALKATMKICDGRLPNSEIKERVFKHFNVNSHQELIPLVYGSLQKKDIAELARIILTTSDDISKEIVERGANEVFTMLLALKKNSKENTLNISFTGGIIENDTPMRRALLERFENSGIKLISKIGDPCYGSYIIGREHVR